MRDVATNTEHESRLPTLTACLWSLGCLLLKLVCFLAFFLLIVWCSGPGMAYEPVQQAATLFDSVARTSVRKTTSILSTTQRTLMSINDPGNHLVYNTVSFYSEYLWIRALVPEPGTQRALYCVLDPGEYAKYMACRLTTALLPEAATNLMLEPDCCARIRWYLVRERILEEAGQEEEVRAEYKPPKIEDLPQEDGIAGCINTCLIHLLTAYGGGSFLNKLLR